MKNQHYFLFPINTPQEIQAFWYWTECHWVPSSGCFWGSLCLHLQGHTVQSKISGTPHPMTQHHTPRRLAWSATPCENFKSCKLHTVLTTASLHNHSTKDHMSSATTQLHRIVSRHGHDTTGNGSVDHIQILASRWLQDQGSHSGAAEVSRLLQCDVMTLGEQFLTFQRCTVSASLGSKTTRQWWRKHDNTLKCQNNTPSNTASHPSSLRLPQWLLQWPNT
jgi:hypothetical protein